MASAKKSAAKSAAPNDTPDIVPVPTAASREADKIDPAPVFRVDLGEALPTPPIRTATDNEKGAKK